MEDNDEDRYELEVERELAEYEAEMQRQHELYCMEREREDSQMDLPPHKRDGYAEMVAEMTDDRLKAMREDGL